LEAGVPWDHIPERTQEVIPIPKLIVINIPLKMSLTTPTAGGAIYPYSCTKSAFVLYSSQTIGSEMIGKRQTDPIKAVCKI
jgi:hypothetical protein